LVQFVLTRTNNSYQPKRVPTQHRWYAPAWWLDFLSLSLLPVKEPTGMFWVYGPFDQGFSKNHRTATCTTPQPLIRGFWGWGSHNPFHLCNWLHKCCFYFSLALFSSHNSLFLCMLCASIHVSNMLTPGS
jgi:hypothetical protein